MADTDKKHPTFSADAIRSDINSAVFLGHPVLDNVVSCVIAMGTELWSTKRRLKVIEAVMAQKGIKPEEIEQFVPTAEQTKAWEADRDRFIDLTMGPLANEGFRSVSADFPKRG